MASNSLLTIANQIIGAPEQGDGFVHILWRIQIQTDPDLRINMMRFGAPGSHYLIPDFWWEGNIHQRVAVYMADFSLPDKPGRPAKAMRPGSHSFPLFNVLMNRLFGIRYRHDSFLSTIIWNVHSKY